MFNKKRKQPSMPPVVPQYPVFPSTTGKKPAAISPAQKAETKNRRPLFYWVTFILSMLLFITLELILNLFGKQPQNTLFWTEIIIPFRQDVRSNLINLYISQISTTFLVTAFLSFLSDNKESVYWTTLVEYKLINPKGTSLRDITWYCLGALITSFICVLLQVPFAFLLSFTLSIVGLSVITCRMIGIFFAKKQIKQDLQQEFTTTSQKGQKEMLLRLEENLISAIRNYDIGCIRDNLKFLESTNLPLADEIVFHSLHIIPKELCSLRLEAAKLLVGFPQDITQAEMNNRNYLQITVMGYDADYPIMPHEQDKLEQKTQWYKQALFVYAFDFLQENIVEGVLFDDECKELLTVFECLNVHRFKDEIGQLMMVNSNKLFMYGELDFKQYFEENLTLLKQAHAAKTNTLPYIHAIKRLHDLFCDSISLVDQSTYDTNSNYYHNNKDNISDQDKLRIPPCYESATAYFYWEDACAIFDSICSLTFTDFNKSLIAFLVEVVAHTKHITQEQGLLLLEKIRNIKIDENRYPYVNQTKELCLKSVETHLCQHYERNAREETNP